jgi:hypothetical protein
MIARLGQVLYWTGCIVAALILAAGFVLFSGTAGGDLLFNASLTVVAATLTFLLGRAARYVLAGTNT